MSEAQCVNQSGGDIYQSGDDIDKNSRECAWGSPGCPLAQQQRVWARRDALWPNSRECGARRDAHIIHGIGNSRGEVHKEEWGGEAGG